jgi:uncharacterized protein YcbX
MTNTAATISEILRYPVKGLSGEKLDRVSLTPGQPLPHDRRFAIENGPSGFDPAAPAYFPKTRFLMLMKNERLAALKTQTSDNGDLVLHHDGQEVARGNLTTPSGRAAIEAFFASFSADELRGPPKVLEAPGHSFSDVAKKVVSIINLASVADLEKTIGKKVDPIRFRGNLYVQGWEPWQEFDLMDRVIAINDARLKVVKRIVRCAATNVDPLTAQRDFEIPKTLLQKYGHADCGIYAEVVSGGEIGKGETITLES